MIIAVTSQNKKSITGHAGKCRNFWVYKIENNEIQSEELLSIEKDQMFHFSHGVQEHPLDFVDILISGGMGFGLQRRLAQKNTKGIITNITDPKTAVQMFLEGTLAELEAHSHSHHNHEH